MRENSRNNRDGQKKSNGKKKESLIKEKDHTEVLEMCHPDF